MVDTNIEERLEHALEVLKTPPNREFVIHTGIGGRDMIHKAIVIENASDSIQWLKEVKHITPEQAINMEAMLRGTEEDLDLTIELIKIKREQYNGITIHRKES